MITQKLQKKMEKLDNSFLIDKNIFFSKIEKKFQSVENWKIEKYTYTDKNL